MVFLDIVDLKLLLLNLFFPDKSHQIDEEIFYELHQHL